jgi:very-short-patch-repair endonuclease
MKKVYGDANIMKDPEHQQKLQYSRGISGIYTFADKTEIRYMGSYEKDFLSYYEHEMKLSSKDIVECPYYFNYRYKNALHTYIPDFYLVSFDLIIEIKEGTNTHPHMEVDREKEALKEAAVLKYSNHHYIKIVEKDYDELLRLVADLKAKD